VTLPPAAVPFSEATQAWSRVAAQSFGGPAGQIAIIHRIIVDEKRWVTEEAQQLATYLGWRLHGTKGGLVAGLLFILPGFLTMLVLSILYAVWRDVTLVSALLFGLKPAVLIIVLEALVRLRRRAAGGTIGLLIGAFAFISIFALRLPFPLVVLGAALAGSVVYRTPASPPALPTIRIDPGPAARTVVTWLVVWLLPVAFLVALLGRSHVLVREALFFSKAAVITFGGAYAVLVYLAQQAVDVYHWVTPREMLDGLGLAETTPGPLIMVVQFVAFLGAYRRPHGLDPISAGILGSLVTVWVTFAPSFLFVFAGAPWMESLRGNQIINAALRGVMAAVVGVILNLAVWFAIHTFFASVDERAWGPVHLPIPRLTTLDPAAVVIAGLAALALFRFKAGMIPVLLGGALLGALVRLAGFP
jgi:chromate transporter